ncbi:MAG: FAD-dependent oxidoreductase [Spirochaetaceae bacterium]
MKKCIYEDPRKLRNIDIDTDVVVVGGGLAGVCTAITAARTGIKVTLIQDRPVLGGNASSEVRLWALGATSHMGNNNRWAREGGVIDEIAVENLHRNKEGNPVLFDMVLLDKVYAEKNITLLLDSAVFQAEFEENGNIKSVKAFCSQNAIMYNVSAPYFCDSSGDGILGYLAGAPYRIGAEDSSEFNEPIAPDVSYGELLGHSIYFYTKDTGSPIEYVAPDIALKDITKVPRFNKIKASDSGCSFWWIEYGGRLDTIHDTLEIKKELWKVAYGIWDYMKNSGSLPETKNLTLEWVGLIPGKRESRRFEGDYMLNQSDVVNQNKFDDAVSYGGWAIDLHPADGVYSERPPCNQYHGKAVYQIPWRCLYSKSIPNLLLNGRLISSSHIAYGSTRVMMTAAHTGQAVGMGISLCIKNSKTPRELLEEDSMVEFQKELIRIGQFIPGLEISDKDDLIKIAKITSLSTANISEFTESDNWESFKDPRAVLLPLNKGFLPKISFKIRTKVDQKLTMQLRTSIKRGGYSPEKILDGQIINITKNSEEYFIQFNTNLIEDEYVFICFIPQSDMSIQLSNDRYPGILSVYHELNEKVSKSMVQKAPEGSGLNSFEFWLPHRRPFGELPSLKFDPPITPYSTNYLKNDLERPYIRSNSWLGNINEDISWVKASWKEKQTANKIVLCFDTDYDHAMETSQFGHPENNIPFCAKHIILRDQDNNIIVELKDNYKTRIIINLDSNFKFSELKLEIIETNGYPAPLYNIRVI